MNNISTKTTFFPSILRLVFLSIALYALIFFIARVAFWIAYEPSHYPLEGADLLKSLWLGLRFDIRLAVLMVLPLFFIGWISPFNPLKNSIAKWLWLLYFTLIFASISMIYIFDFGHYAYLGKRLDFTAFRFLEDAYLSMVMVWESYSVVPILIGWLVSIIITSFMLKQLIQKLSKVSFKPLSIPKGIGIGIVAFVALFVLAYSKLSQYPLRWSDAAFSKHPFATELTYNPVHYLFDTWKNGSISYDKSEVEKYYTLMADFLQVDNPNSATLSYLREVNSTKHYDKKPNVVIIIVESLASYKTSISNNPLDPTPFMASLAKDGYYFDNFFTPSTGTARSIFTTITSLPDVELRGTSSRNPLIVDQRTILNDFDGYGRFYFIGGSASWGNIRGILSKNIDDLQLYEEEHYSSPRNDVWGISDIDLFAEADAVLKEQKKPFVAIIQTSGNHRPYTIPPKERTRGFESLEHSDLDVTRYGFESLEELNAYRLMDHSVEYFFSLAKSNGYLDNTIFAFYGDHGINGYAGEHTHSFDSTSALSLGSHRVPFVIYSTAHIKEPKRFNKVVSEVDVLATVAALSGQDYTATALGRDMLDERYDKSRYAFTISHKNPPLIGMVGERFYFTMLGDDSNSWLYDLQSSTPTEDVSSKFKEKSKMLKELTLGYYKSAQYIPYFNKRESR